MTEKMVTVSSGDSPPFPYKDADQAEPIQKQGYSENPKAGRGIRADGRGGRGMEGTVRRVVIL